ncbi:MAG: hypothetical protein A3B68_03150 [Candidatus Melainabacteria bacterium RIFCSPHIGHO2_02_FULL_34_12]|nr:MAG: hypothetical protein A3B68_03150 [Candidatus Melainabacteria bacterium RIFCSPHIGHO2_02_FULL_34_12]
MNTLGIIGRVPVLRDRVLFPVNRSDGGQSYLTAREALQFQDGIENANRRSLQNPNATKQPNIFLELFNFAIDIFSRFNSRPSA